MRSLELFCTVSIPNQTQLLFYESEVAPYIVNRLKNLEPYIAWCCAALLDLCSEIGWFHIDEVNVFLWDPGFTGVTYAEMMRPNKVETAVKVCQHLDSLCSGRRWGMHAKSTDFV